MRRYYLRVKYFITSFIYLRSLGWSIRQIYKMAKYRANRNSITEKFKDFVLAI